jgi:mRNA-degrading endonuclease toxin of MazEF toxin-antitoxin module
MSRDRYERGDVVWAEDPFKAGDTSRPWLVLSSETHPFHGEQYVCCLLTTTPRRAAVELDEDDWKAGGTPEKSYVNPWVPMSLDHDAAINRQGALRPWVVDGVAAEVARYVGVEPTQ